MRKNVRKSPTKKERITLIEKYRLFSEMCEFVRYTAYKEGWRTEKYPDECFQMIALGVFGVWYQKHMIVARGEQDVNILML